MYSQKHHKTIPFFSSCFLIDLAAKLIFSYGEKNKPVFQTPSSIFFQQEKVNKKKKKENCKKKVKKKKRDELNGDAEMGA